MSHPRSPELITHVQSHVLSASARLYLEKGFTRTTVKDIAAESGIGLPLLMRVMKSKEDILAKLVTFVLESQFSATKGFLADCDYDPILFYAAETTLQLYMAESSEGVRDLYATAYSLPKTAAIIQNAITDKLMKLFGAYHPDWTWEDFYLREIASGGIVRDFMAHPCNDWLTMERKVAAFLETTFRVYHIPEEKTQDAIRFVAQFDYHQLARGTIDAMLSRLEQTMHTE